MGKTSVTKSYSAANSIAAGASASILFGPIFVTHLDDWTLMFHNSSAISINFNIHGSFDRGRSFGAAIPASQLTNTNFGEYLCCSCE